MNYFHDLNYQFSNHSPNKDFIDNPFYLAARNEKVTEDVPYKSCNMYSNTLNLDKNNAVAQQKKSELHVYGSISNKENNTGNTNNIDNTNTWFL